MITQCRTELFSALAELCRHYPNWRFGQLVSNVSGWAGIDIWDVEDEQLLAAAPAHIDSFSDREREVEV
jgi:hypothetical protein